MNEIDNIIYNLYTIAHHIYTRIYHLNKEFETWFNSYSFPKEDIDAMQELQKNWFKIVYNSIDNLCLTNL